MLLHGGMKFLADIIAQCVSVGVAWSVAGLSSGDVEGACVSSAGVEDMGCLCSLVSKQRSCLMQQEE